MVWCGVKVDKITTSTATCKIEYYECEPGTYLPKGKTACETCPAGSYCEGMDNLLVNPDKDQGIKSCGEGYYSNNGASSSDECIPQIYYVNFYCDNSKESIIDTQDVSFGGKLYGPSADVVNATCQKAGYEPLQYICTNINVPLDGTTQYVSPFAEECFVEWNQISIDCPAGTYLPARSTSAANCTLCEEGSYCPGGSAFTLNDTEPRGIFDCASVGTGNYNLSDAGASSADECYTMAETACYDPCGGAKKCTTCPKNFLQCVYITTEKVATKKYSNGSVETSADTTCPIDDKGTVSACESPYYMENAECKDCRDLSKECYSSSGTPTSCYNLSSSAYGTRGPAACYADCIASCNAVSAGVCPENSFDCLDVSNTVGGSRFYGQASCTASEFCSFGFGALLI